LTDAIGQLATTRAGNYRAYRSELGVDGAHLPAEFGIVTEAVAAFADPLLGVRDDNTRWDPRTRVWHSGPAEIYRGNTVPNRGDTVRSRGNSAVSRVTQIWHPYR